MYGEAFLIDRESASPSSACTPRLELYHYFILVAVVALPLQSAFLLPASFPVRKISDICVILALCVFMLSRGSARRPRSRYPVVDLALLALACWVLISFYVGVFASPGDTEVRAYFITPNFDLAWMTVRGLIVLCLWRLGATVPLHHMYHAIRLAVWVAVTGVAIQVLFFALGIDSALAAVGFDMRPSGMNLGGIVLPRNGTFPSGQELGLMASLGVFIALKGRRYFLLGASVICLVYSLSTTGFLAVAAGLSAALWIDKSSRTRRVVAAAVCGTASAAVFIPYVRSALNLQLAKFGLTNSDIWFATRSLNVRLTKTNVAFQMARDHPWFGIGAGRFGNLAPSYPDAWSLPSRVLVTTENGYAQIAAEHGFIALGLLVLTLLIVARAIVVLRLPFELGILICIAVGLSTQSLWTETTIWVGLAYVSCAVHNTSRPGSPCARVGGPPATSSAQP